MDQVKFVEGSFYNMLCLSRPYHFKFFKGCLPQISIGPFLNTLSHMIHDVNFWADKHFLAQWPISISPENIFTEDWNVTLA